ncbi:DUF58 domain-containing protein [Candidatus Leptofilum sp.]|uniref:DUF58 domain-containing protein n=1 Tax=Candidatus Leptofilum sp. TaxID=3241576 RepID=UPI003B5C74DD
MGNFSALIIILLLIAFYLRVDFIFYVIYVSVGIYAWGRWLMPRAQKNLKSRRRYDRQAFWGEVVPVIIELTNGGRLPVPWIQLQESVAIQLKHGKPLHQVVSLRRSETAEFEYTIIARRRGYYQLGPLRLTTGDLFGIYPEQVAFLPADHLTIYPRITPLTQLGLPSRLPFGTIASHQRLFEDPARPMGIRDFRSGDTIRQINWKASAHTRNLMVKTFQPAISLETAVLLNLHTPDYTFGNRQDIAEWAIEVAASLAAHLVNQRQSVGLITNGIDPLASQQHGFDEATGRLLRPSHAEIQANPAAFIPAAIPPRNGRPHLIKILERLARIEAEETVPFVDWAGSACSHLNWGVTILAITANGSEAVCQSLHRLVRAGFNPILIAIEPNYDFGLVRERARRLGFTAYNVHTPRDLDRWRRPYQMGVAP